MTTWKDGGKYGRMRRVVIDEKSVMIGEIWTGIIRYGCVEPWPEGKANFRLILAAPKMLEALEVIRDKADLMMEIRDGSVGWTDWQPVRSVANAAIAAVKGENDDLGN